MSLLTITVVTTSESFNLLREDWTDLNEQSSKGTIFSSWEWLYTWWKTYHNDGQRKLYILTCYDQDKNLIGIAPFQILNNPKRYFPCSRQLLFLGSGETDGSMIFGEYMDLIIKVNHEEDVIDLFSNFLLKNKSLWDGIKFQILLEASHVASLFQNKNEIERQITPYGVRSVIDLPDSYKDYLMSLRKKMRSNITRVRKRLENEQQFTIEKCDSLDEVHASLNILADLNRERRDAIQQSSMFKYKRFNQFHHSLADYLQPQNKLRFNILRFNNEPVAALYSFVDKGMNHFYQTGFKVEYGQRYSLISTMLTQEISASIENKGISQVNFMFSDDDTSYKVRFSSRTETLYNIAYEKNDLKSKLKLFIHQRIKSMIKKIKTLKKK